MNFSWALEQLKAGKMVQLEGWKGHIEYVEEDTDERLEPYLLFVKEDHSAFPWMPGNLSLMSNDWMFYFAPDQPIAVNTLVKIVDVFGHRAGPDYRVMSRATVNQEAWVMLAREDELREPRLVRESRCRIVS